MYVYVVNEGDYDRTRFNYYNDPQAFKNRLMEITNAKLRPVVWLVPDDASTIAHQSCDIKKLVQ
jgi:hypothetical protein